MKTIRKFFKGGTGVIVGVVIAVAIGVTAAAVMARRAAGDEGGMARPSFGAMTGPGPRFVPPGYRMPL